MPLLLSFCNNEVLFYLFVPLDNQLGTKPQTKHSFTCNLSCKLLKFFNQNPWTKSEPGHFQFDILPSIFFKLAVVISIFSCFLTLSSLCESCNHCILLMICRLTPYVSPNLFRFFSHGLIIITPFFFLI